MVGISDNTRQWAHPLRKGFTPTERVDLTETVLFSSSNRVSSGSLKGQFRLSDLITKFRITVNAIDVKGAIGYKKMNFQSNKPLYVNFDVPTTMTLGDKIKVDMRIGNLNSFSLNVRITSAPATDGGISYTIPAGTFTVRPRTSVSRSITISALQVTKGQTFIKIGVSARSNGMNFEDALTLPIRVLPKGFPRQQNSGGMLGSRSFSNDTPSSVTFPFNIPSTIQDNSAVFKFQLFSSNFAQLTSAISALIQEPSGCFEQTSSTLYPMIMGMQYLQALPSD